MYEGTAGEETDLCLELSFTSPYSITAPPGAILLSCVIQMTFTILKIFDSLSTNTKQDAGRM